MRSPFRSKRATLTHLPPAVPTNAEVAALIAAWALSMGQHLVAGDSIVLDYRGADMPDDSTLRVITVAEMQRLLYRLKAEVEKARPSQLRQAMQGILSEVSYR